MFRMTWAASTEITYLKINENQDLLILIIFTKSTKLKKIADIQKRMSS